MNELRDLPGIGKVNAAKLNAVGIETPQQFREIGAQEAFLRVRGMVDSGACVHMLMGFRAAELGVAKVALPDEERRALRAFFDSVK